MYPSQTISLAIDRPYAEVYRFLAAPSTLNRWTAGVLQGRIEKQSDWIWQASHDGGVVQLEFTPPNEFGVLDLTVTGDDIVDRCYRVRVFPNGRGTDLCITLFQGEGEPDTHFRSECDWLRTDLSVLKAYLEK
jgi:uncharacterized protein YndB with AHSA1/START domain